MIEVKEFLARYKTAQRRKINWGNLYQEAAEFFLPHREIWMEENTGRNDFFSPNMEIYDSTAQSLLDDLVNLLSATMTPSNQSFVALEPGWLLKQSLNPAALKAVKEQLQVITEVFFETLSDSNFDTQSAESYYDLCFGTAMLLQFEAQDKGSPYLFESAPIDRIFLEPGPFNTTHTFWRQNVMEGRNIELTWPKGNLSDELKEMISRAPDKEHTIVDGIIASDYQAGAPTKFDYMVVHEGRKELIYSSSSASSPAHIFRWSARPGQAWGWGPALNALADVKSLNMSKQLILDAASLSLSPVFTYVADMVPHVKNITFRPGEMIPVRTNGNNFQGDAIKQLFTETRVDVGQFIFSELKKSITEIMFGQPLGDVDLPVKSATEHSLRKQHHSQRTNSTNARIGKELVASVTKRSLYILESKGMINTNQLRIGGGEINAKFKNPLAQSQDEALLANWTQFSDLILQRYGQQAHMMIVDPKTNIPYLADLLGVPGDKIPSPEQFDRMGEMAAQMAQQQGMAPL